MAHVQPAPVENPLLRLVETGLVLIEQPRGVRTEKLPRLVARNATCPVLGQPVSGVDPPTLFGSRTVSSSPVATACSVRDASRLVRIAREFAWR